MKNIQLLLNSKGFNLVVDGIIGAKTKQAAEDWAKSECSRLGYKWMGKTIIGIRMDSTFTDKLSDFALVVVNGKVVEIVAWTTKAGQYYVSNPLTVGGITGTGVIKEGQYINSHKFGSGKYKFSYFKQINPLQVYRDGNKDNKVDKNIIQFAPSWYAFQLHPMGKGFKLWNWSAGCNGSSDESWEKQILPYFSHHEVISYTLLEA